MTPKHKNRGSPLGARAPPTVTPANLIQHDSPEPTFLSSGQRVDPAAAMTPAYMFGSVHVYLAQGRPPSGPPTSPPSRAARPLTCRCISSICLRGMPCKMPYTSDSFSSGTTTDALGMTAGQSHTHGPLHKDPCISSRLILRNRKLYPPSSHIPSAEGLSSSSSSSPVSSGPTFSTAFSSLLRVLPPHHLCTPVMLGPFQMLPQTMLCIPWGLWVYMSSSLVYSFPSLPILNKPGLLSFSYPLKATLGTHLRSRYHVPVLGLQ